VSSEQCGWAAYAERDSSVSSVGARCSVHQWCKDGVGDTRSDVLQVCSTGVVWVDNAMTIPF
jgi:hypothetical protein